MTVPMTHQSNGTGVRRILCVFVCGREEENFPTEELTGQASRVVTF